MDFLADLYEEMAQLVRGERLHPARSMPHNQQTGCFRLKYLVSPLASSESLHVCHAGRMSCS